MPQEDTRMNENIRPQMALPIRATEDINTAILPVIQKDPITPIPPALRPNLPFFSGSMPLPPSVDDAYQVVKVYVTDRSGNRVLKHRIGPSEALESFKEQAAWTLKQATIDYRVVEAIKASNVRRVKTPLAVHLSVYFATPWRRDLDGPIKYAIDAAFQQIGLNDNLICHIDDIDKQVDHRNPRVEIEIRCLSAWGFSR